jgi:hypothetical protein
MITQRGGKYSQQYEKNETISRLRVDLNILEICQGNRKGLDKSERFCPKCVGHVETVDHFLLHYSAYAENRTVLRCTYHFKNQHGKNV